MRNIILVVAKSNNNIIGNNNKLLWEIKDDLKWFKELTLNKTIVMGRKTYESIGKALPNRKNIVLSTDLNFKPNDVILYENIERLLLENNEDLYIIGGGQIYREFLNYSNKMFITEVDTNIEGDTMFPIINEDFWFKILIKEINKNSNNEYNCKIYNYIKKTNINMKELKNIIKLYPNDYDLGSFIRNKYNYETHIFYCYIKQYPNNYDLGSFIRKLF